VEIVVVNETHSNKDMKLRRISIDESDEVANGCISYDIPESFSYIHSEESQSKEKIVEKKFVCRGQYSSLWYLMEERFKGYSKFADSTMPLHRK